VVKSDLAWLAAELSSIRRTLTPADESSDLVLALDQGGHASRALLFDLLGRQVAEAHVPVATRREAGDRVEQDPEELVSSLKLAAQDVCDSELARERTVIAAGLATQRSTIVCWDRTTGRALSEALSWQDRRAAEWLEQFRTVEPVIRERTGLVLSAHYGASKLRWSLHRIPAVGRALHEGRLAAGSLSSFLAFRLLRENPVVVDPSNASRTLLFDPVTRDWSPELLDLFEIPAGILPRCVPTRHEFGTLEIGERRIPLRICTGDQSAATFASGMPDPCVAYVNIGTGAFVQRCTEHEGPLPDGLLRSVLYSDGTRVTHTVEGTVNGAGSAIEWFGAQSALDVKRALRSLAHGDGQAEPPLFMNGIGGLGAPYWSADFPVEFVGEGDELAQLRAIVESIAFLLCVNIERLQQTGPLTYISCAGGLAQCDYLCQALADLSGLPVERETTREATARGVAYLAADQPSQWQQELAEKSFAPGSADGLRARFARWREETERRLAR
jgi:glycerol kinase